MHKILLFTFLFNLIALATPAASFTNLPQDTLTVDSANYHLNQKEFLDAYGHNEKSSNFINLFFKKRNIGKKILVAGGVTLLTCGILATAFGASAGGYAFLFAVVLFLGLVAGFVLALIGLSLLVSYSRKKLLKKLQHPELLPPSIDQPRHRPHLFKKNRLQQPVN